MPRFTYNAIDASGAEQGGVIEAPGRDQVAALLRGRGLWPTSIGVPGAAAQPAAPRRLLGLPFASAVPAKDLAVFTRQLSTLLRAGMPLLRALEVLARQETGAALREVIQALAADIRSGGTLSGAAARHPRVFDRLHVSMLRAGEAGGVLDTVLERLAGFAEKSLHLRSRLRVALAYPAVVLLVAAAVVAGLLVFVVPRFQEIFAGLLKGAPLPPLTQAVIAAGSLVRGHGAALVGGLAVLVAGFAVFRRSEAGRRVLAGMALGLPVVGGLILKAAVARFSRTLGTLLASGVPILPSLLITADTCGNLRVAGALRAVHDRVKAGEPVARPLEEAGVFPPMVASMVEVGEHTGQLPAMLHKVADIYDGEVDAAVAGLGALLEPALIVFLAVVVGTVVVALFLPIIRIVQLLA